MLVQKPNGFIEPVSENLHMSQPACSANRYGPIKVSKCGHEGDEYEPHEAAAIAAVDRWKNNVNRKFPATGEVIRVLQRMGWRQVVPPHDCGECRGRGKIAGGSLCRVCYGIGRVA